MPLQGPMPSLAQDEPFAYGDLPEPPFLVPRASRSTLTNMREGSTSHQASVPPIPLPSLFNQAPQLGLENSSILRPLLFNEAGELDLLLDLQAGGRGNADSQGKL